MSLRDCVAYKVFIASPGDCSAESEAAYRRVLEWNARHTPTMRRVMIPVRWTHQMIPVAGGDPQDLINEQLLADSDLLVAIFKGQLGSTRGTEREVRYFMEHGKARRVMLFVRDDVLRDPQLGGFLLEMRDNAAFIQEYIAEQDLLEHLEEALLRRAQVSLAARHVSILRGALIVRVREWRTLERNSVTLVRAFQVLSVADSDLTRFSQRDAGLGIGVLDSRVEDLSARLQALIHSEEFFIEQSPWDEATDVIADVGRLLQELPEERDLL